jgi:acetyl-CoA acetyltransferase
MTPTEIRDRWLVRRDELRRLKASVDGAALCDELLSDLEAIVSGADETPITISKAAALSGFSADHIGRLVRDGKLKNVGRKHAPRVLASELPRRAAGQVAPARKRRYDPASDARSLRRPAVRSDHGS